MKTRFAVLLFVATLITTQAWAGKPTVLPDACGADIKFDVKTEKSAPTPAPPAEGKAQLFLIADFAGWTFSSYNIRFGMDGKWLGATKGTSYFAVSITPGEHHFCGSFQSSKKQAADMVGILSFTAEAGKSYYLEYSFTASGSPEGMVLITRPNFFLATEDDGKYRVKAFPLATSTPKN
jgi:hypothetical protein